MAWVWVTESPCAARTASTLAAAVVPEPRVLHRDSAAALFDVVMAERTVDKTLGSCASAAKLAVSSRLGPATLSPPATWRRLRPASPPRSVSRPQSRYQPPPRSRTHPHWVCRARPLSRTAGSPSDHHSCRLRW